MTKLSGGETATPRHPRDISAADLEVAMAAQDNPDLLGQLVEISRSVFGFYPTYFPYTITYPWASERISRLPAGSHVLDIGAGVSPVPLYLATKGIVVECVDNSKHMRTLPATGAWNEWGFLDYGALHPNLKSHHCDITKFEPSGRFDVIYSIAVLAHMPRTVRENTLLRCRDWLKPPGSLLLVIDVIPSTDFIWNRSEGVEVESPIQHGTIDDLADELKRLGFRIHDWEVVRTVYKSRTDLLFIVCSTGN
jgi:cyclopropane fatty-acyl-phospholipid synthase-like methyltransferase